MADRLPPDCFSRRSGPAEGVEGAGRNPSVIVPQSRGDGVYEILRRTIHERVSSGTRSLSGVSVVERKPPDTEMKATALVRPPGHREARRRTIPGRSPGDSTSAYSATPAVEQLLALRDGGRGRRWASTVSDVRCLRAPAGSSASDIYNHVADLGASSTSRLQHRSPRTQPNCANKLLAANEQVRAHRLLRGAITVGGAVWCVRSTWGSWRRRPGGRRAGRSWRWATLWSRTACTARAVLSADKVRT